MVDVRLSDVVFVTEDNERVNVIKNVGLEEGVDWFQDDSESVWNDVLKAKRFCSMSHP